MVGCKTFLNFSFYIANDIRGKAIIKNTANMK
jgi:hypothetical protein